MTKRILLCLLFSNWLVACGHIPYRIDVDQGNLITEQQLNQLTIGMSKMQVQQTLGSTLLSDVFHNNRWDYVQSYKKGTTQKMEKSKVSLYFTNDLLSNIERKSFKTIETEPVPYSQ